MVFMRILPAEDKYIPFGVHYINKGFPIVLPTDTLYGICADATNPKAVEKIYNLKWRNPKKPLIVLIENLRWLETFFHLKPSEEAKIFLLYEKSISVILPVKGFSYISRDTNGIAFRLVKKGFIKNFLKKLGKPIVAPSANWEGHPPAKTVYQAYIYFGDNVPVYFDGGMKIGAPSALVEANHIGNFFLLRRGELSDEDLRFLKIKNI